MKQLLHPGAMVALVVLVVVVLILAGCDATDFPFGRSNEPQEEPRQFDEDAVSEINAQGDMAIMFANNGRYDYDQMYITIMGIVNGQWSWVDVTTGEATSISETPNDMAPPEGKYSPFAGYADIFRKASDIPGQIFPLGNIESGKMFIAFNSPLYMYFHPTGGFTAPDLNNPDDINAGIRFEVVEFTLNDNDILWINSSRVDAYQYGMGVEVWGFHDNKDWTYETRDGFDYVRIGELLHHDDILARWQQTVSAPFQYCLRDVIDGEDDGIIEQPSKVPEFKEGGLHSDFFDAYIDQIWEVFADHDMVIDTGDFGIWRGRVQGGSLSFTADDHQSYLANTGSIPWKPTTQDAIEAKGALDTGSKTDRMLQSRFSAGVNRHAIHPDEPARVVEFSDGDTFFTKHPHNEYTAFLHNPEVSYNSRTYAFAYDDVGDHSSTIVFTDPRKIRITIGGFWGLNMD